MKRAILAAAVAALSFVGFAKTINVPLYGDIAAAVAGAEAGDVVQLAAGEYTLSATVTIAKGITVKGAGRSLTTVNGGKACQLFVLSNADAVLSDLTVTGGKAATGAGVKITAGTLQDAAVENCEATASKNAGAGVWLEGTQSAVRRCEIKGCTTGGYGGGIYAKGSTVVESCRVTGNGASWGGGIYVDSGSSVRVVQSSLFGNLLTNGGVESNGRDVYVWSASNTKCLNCYAGKGIKTDVTPQISGCVQNVSDATEADLVGKGVDLSGEAGLNGLDINRRVFNFGSTEVLPSAGCVEYNPQCNVRTDELEVTGQPEELGDVTPAYGLTNGLASAETFTCTAPASPVELGDGRIVTCVGYNLYTNRFATLDEWLPWAEGSTTSFSYTHPECARAKLVWKWLVKAPLGVKKPTYISFEFDSSVVAAEVTGIGLDATSATLTFAYGTAQDALDNTVKVSVTDAGTWRATLTGLEVGTHYYVQATLANGVDDPVTSDVFEFDQPDVEEDSGSSSAHVSTVGFSGSWQKLFDLGGLVIKPDWSNVTIGLGHLTGAGCNNDDEWGRNPRVNANGELEFQYACIPDSLLKIGKGALKVENGAVYGKQIGSYYVSSSTIPIETADVDDPEQSAKYNTSNVTQPNGYTIVKVTCIIKSEIVLKPMNGGFAASMVPAADERTAYLYASATYGGTDGWGDPIETVTVPAGAGRAEFARVADWGTTLRYARVKIVDGNEEAWSRTYTVPPPAPLGVEKPSYVSSEFGSSVVAAQVTGIGMTASSATLTFAYGTTPDCADGAVQMAVDNAGSWCATLPHLQSGTTYYVKATLSNGEGDDPVESEVLSVEQPASDDPLLPFGYVKTEYVQSSGNQYIDTGVLGRDGLEVRTKMMWMTVPSDGGYLAARSGNNRVYPIYCYPSAWDIGYYENYYNGSPKANTLYDVYSVLKPGDQRLVVDGTTVISKTDARSISAGCNLYLFAMNYGSPTYHSSARCYSLQIWEQGELTRDYVPCYSKAEGVYGLYDFKNRTFSKSGNSNALLGPEIPADDRGIRIAFAGAKSATLAIEKSDTASTLYRVNGSTYGGEDAAAWDSVTEIGQVAASGADLQQLAPFGDDWGADAYLARFFLVTGTTTNWSETAIWQPPAPLGVEKPTYVSSVFGSSDIAATVTGIGKTASEATLTFAYGTTTNCADGTVTVENVTDAGLWSGTLPHLIAGQTYYVKATLSNTTGDTSVTSDVTQFVQPATAEEGLDPRLRPLPDGYVQMEKLTSTGNEYVLIDYWKPDNATASEAEIGEFVWKSDCALFGQSYNGNQYLMTIQGSKFKWYGPGTEIYPTATTVDPAADYQIKITPTSGGNGDVTILNRTTGDTATKNQSLAAGSGNFALFAANGGSNKATFSLYSFQAWKNDQISIDLVPAYKTATEEVGLVDLVTGEFRASSATAFAKQAFVEGVALELKGDKLVVTAPASDETQTVYLYAGETYGGTNGWGAAIGTKTLTAGETTAEFDLPADWGRTVWFARAKVGEGDAAVWSKTLIAADANLPAVSLNVVDGLGGDTMVVKGTVDSLGTGPCTLTVSTGASEDALTEAWTGLEGATATETGDFELTLFEGDTTASRYLKPGETYFVRVELTDANGKVAWSSVKSVTMASAAVFGTQSASITSKRVMTVTAQMKDLGMTGETMVELWVGADAGSLVKVDSVVVTNANETFTLTNELAQYETPYVWQLKAVNASAGKTADATTPTATASITANDKATYTWTGAGADNKWSNPDNWEDDKDGDSLGWPQVSTATAKFTDDATVDVDVTTQVSSLNVGVVNKTVTFVSDTEPDAALSAGSMTWPGAGGRWVLDGASFTIPGYNVWPVANSTIVLTNAASMTVNGSIYVNQANTKFLLFGRSTLTAASIYGANGRSIVVDDSTVTVTGTEYLGSSAGAMSVLFKGKNPRWVHTGTGQFYVGSATATVQFDFDVPVGGFTSAPIVASVATSKYMLEGSSPLVTFNVLPESPAARVDETITTDLVCWPKGVMKAKADLGTLPAEKPGNAFAWSDATDYPTNLAVTIVGSAHNDRLTVAGEPADVPDEDDAISPKYGNYETSPTSLAAPAITAPFADGTRRAICLGWKLYDIDPATQLPGAEPVATSTDETKLAYEWTNVGKWQKFVWQWEVQSKVVVESESSEKGSVSPESAWVTEGETVTLTATPADQSWRFYKWTGDVPVDHERDNPLVLSVDQAKNVTALFGRVRYVAMDGDDGNEGTGPSAAKAFATLKKALSVANQDGDLVKIGAGTFDVTDPVASGAMYEIDNEVLIVGEGRENTVLQTLAQSTKGNTRLFRINNARATLQALTIDSFTYVGGDYTSGLCIYLQSGRIVDCKLSNISHTGGNHYSNGIYINGSNALVSNVVFRVIGNRVLEVYGSGSGVKIYDLDIEGCDGGYGGSIVSIKAGAATADGLRIVDGTGTGLSVDAGRVQNVLIDGISGSGSGAAVSGSGDLRYATVVNCTSTKTDGRDGLYQTGGTVRYSIFAQNGIYAGALVTGGNFASNLTDKVIANSGEGCLVGDPQFANPENGDYNLQIASLAKDAVDDPTVTYDLVHTPRPVDAKNDLGCYERVSSGGALVAGFKVDGLPEGLLGDAFTFVAVADGDLEGVEYAWTLDGAPAGTGATLVLTPGYGKHTMKLVVTNAKQDEVVVEKSDVIEVHPTRVYVSHAGSSTYPYATIETAATNVNTAMTSLWPASPEPATVEVAEGVFTDTDIVNMTFPVTIVGAGCDKTVITAPNLPWATRAFEIKHAEAVLTSLTVSNAVYGGGQFFTGAAAYLSAGKVVDCCFTHIGYNNPGLVSHGFTVEGSGFVSNCVFRSIPKGGINISSTATVMDVVVEDCGSGYNGGQVDVKSGSPIVDGLRIVGGSGRGLYVGAGTVQNVLVDGVRNVGVEISGGLLQYATVVNCTSTSTDGRDGLSQTGGKVMYSIFARNGVNAGALVTGGTFVTNLTDKVIANSGEGCLVGDPQFAAPENGDYNLTIGSAAKDVVDDPTVAFDVVRTPRPQGKKNDLGAFERVSGSGELVAGFKVNGVPEGLTGTEFEFEAVADGDLEGVEYKWYLDGSDELIGTGAILRHVPGYGKHSVKLVVTNGAGGEAVVEKQDVVEVHPTHVYVSHEGSSTYPYETPAKAATNVNTAMSSLWTATPELCTVEIAEGTYTNTDLCNMSFPVEVIGAGRDKTFIEAPNLPVLTKLFILNNPWATLQAVTVTNVTFTGTGDNYNSGFGATMSAGRILDCAFGGISAKNINLPHAYGVYVSGANSLVSNCVFTGISGALEFTSGGKAYDILAVNCSKCWGASIVSMAGSGVFLDGLRVIGGSGPGLTISAGTAQNVLVDGISGSNSGVTVSGGTLQYATVVNCTSTSTDGRDGLYQTGGTVRYSIFAQNGSYAGALLSGGTFTSNLTDKVVANSGAGCKVGDPQFADAANGDYNLKFASPARDAAEGDASVAFDLVRTARPVGDWNDLGCYERPETVEPLTAGFNLTSAPEGLPGASFTFVQAVAGDLAGITFRWYVDGSDDPASEEETFTLTPASGKHTVKLVVENGKDERSEFEAVDVIEVHPTKVFVSHEGSATYPFDTAATAATNVNQALTSLWTASPATCTVSVAEGVYTNVDLCNLNFPVEVVGAGRDKTVLSAPSLPSGKRMFELRNAGAAVRSLAISNVVTRSGSNGFAAYVQSGAVTDCRFCDISANSSYALYTDGAGTLVSNCVFRSLANGAVRTFAAATVVDLLVEKCGSTQVSVEGGARFERMIVRDGTGLGVNLVNGYLLNALVCGNRTSGSAAGVSQTGGTMVNCTVADNVSTATGGYGSVLTGNNTTVRNSIFAGEGGNVVSIGESVKGGDNITTEPPSALFTAKKSRAYHLKQGSPAVDAGNKTILTTLGITTDLDGHDRIWLRGKRASATVDCGCYEFFTVGTMVIVR